MRHNKFYSVAGPLVLISVCALAYFIIFPSDLLTVTAPIATLLKLTKAVSPWLYGVIAVLILSSTITKVWGTKQQVRQDSH